MDGSRRLGKRAHRAIAAAIEDDLIMVSAVTFYEIALLIAAGRLPRHTNAATIRERALSEGLMELPVCGTQSLDAAGLDGLPLDPMDRFIVAAARHARAQLVTADTTILGWSGAVQRLDATA